MNLTKQEKAWVGKLGKQYNERNPQTLGEMDFLWQERYGFTRSLMNDKFLEEIPRDIRILEVGCGTGTQLLLLQDCGFLSLYGIDIQKFSQDGFDIIRGSALDIPFKDDYFDLVFTSGLLIHISPSDINRALDEIYRCTKQYIWGFEYFAEKWTDIDWRGKTGLVWKTNYAQLFLDRFGDLRLVKQAKFKYLENDNVDIMFLLEKI